MPPDLTLWEQIDENTGRVMPPNQYAKWERLREKEHQEKLRVLRSFGLRGGRGKAKPVGDKIMLVGLMSGHAESLLKTPRWNCLPWVARAQRRELLLNATFYFHHRPGCRHIRVTHGPRVPLTRLRSAVQNLSKAISRLNTRDWFAERAEVVLRAVEITWDQATAHVHAHLILRPKSDLSESDWITLSGRIRQYFDADVSDLTPLGNINEAVPYLTKSSELDGFSGDGLATYIHQLRGLRTHEPMGEFREFCRDLDTTKTKLVHRGNEIVRISRSDGLRRRSGDGCRSASTKAKHKDPPTNQIVRLGPPRPHGSPYSEPVLMVRNFDGDHENLLAAYPDMEELREQLMPQWPRQPRHQTTPAYSSYKGQIIDQPAPASSSRQPATLPSPRNLMPMPALIPLLAPLGHLPPATNLTLIPLPMLLAKLRHRLRLCRIRHFSTQSVPSRLRIVVLDLFLAPRSLSPASTLHLAGMPVYGSVGAPGEAQARKTAPFRKSILCNGDISRA